jgi:hypothetical protein
MKRLHLLVFLGFLCALTVNAQTDTDRGGVKMSQGLDPLYAHLELNTDLIKLQVCSGDRLRFTMRLNFTNKGENVVILDKRSTAITQYMMSRNFKNAIKKKYEIKVPIFFGLDGVGMTMDSVPDESQFVVLKPSETYSPIRVLTTVFGDDSDGDGFRRFRELNFLQMEVLTWYYPRASNIKWRDQWQTKGYLWSDPITSIPMPFKVENNTPVVNCL